MTENPSPQKIPLIFFRSGNATEPVREWLKELPEAERHAVGKDLLRAHWRWPVGMPLCRPMGSGLLGNPHRSADEAQGACNVVPVPRAFGGTARLHQENAGNARRGSGAGAQAPEGVNEMSKKHMGSSIDDFLKAEGVFEEAQSQARQTGGNRRGKGRVVAWRASRGARRRRRRGSWRHRPGLGNGERLPGRLASRTLSGSRTGPRV